MFGPIGQGRARDAGPQRVGQAAAEDDGAAAAQGLAAAGEVEQCIVPVTAADLHEASGPSVSPPVTFTMASMLVAMSRVPLIVTAFSVPPAAVVPVIVEPASRVASIACRRKA